MLMKKRCMMVLICGVQLKNIKIYKDLMHNDDGFVCSNRSVCYG